jgi:hypothetical protein
MGKTEGGALFLFPRFHAFRICFEFRIFPLPIRLSLPLENHSTPHV